MVPLHEPSSLSAPIGKINDQGRANGDYEDKDDITKREVVEHHGSP
jgi:hypothetical protein